MLDLHCHILPGIDDGAADMSEAIGMAEALVAAGFQSVAASPHMGSGPGGDVPADVALHVQQMLAEQLAKEGVALEVLANGEHYLTAELFARISAAEVVTIGGRSRWLLTELPWGGLADVEGVLFRLQTRGLRILLAHPERHSYLELATLARLVERGICIQVELGSYIGLYGHDEEVRAWDMLNKGLTHVIATDLHCAAGARDWIPEALQAMAKSLGREAVERGTRHNPQLIIRDASADDLVPLG